MTFVVVELKGVNILYHPKWQPTPFDFKGDGMIAVTTVVQRQTAVTAYLKSKQLLLFVFAQQHSVQR